MGGGDGNRSFADGRRHPFDAARSYVTDRKHAWHARFQQRRTPGEKPFGCMQIFSGQIRSCLDKTFRIEHDAAEPVCTGNRTGHNENMSDRAGLQFAGPIVPPEHAFEAACPFQGRQSGTQVQGNTGIFGDPPDEVVRHALRETPRADQQMDVLCRLGEKHGGLSSGAASSDHNHLFGAAQLRFHKGGSIADADTYGRPA